MICIRMAGLNVGIENRFDFSHRVRGFETEDSPDFTVSVSAEELERERELGGDMPEDYLEFVCAYRQIAERLPECDAFVMHGAAAALDGREAYLFTAPSGTGKSTHLKLWQLRFWGRTSVLNGDKPVIRKIDGVFQVCGTPWRGKENLGTDAILPLKGISILRRSAENRAVRIAVREAVPSLMRQVYLPKDPERLARFLALLNECLASVPVYDLACDRSSAAPVTSYEAMTGEPAGPEPVILPALLHKLHEFDAGNG